MHRLVMRTAVSAVLTLLAVGCGQTPTITVQTQPTCQPINKYDTRCEQQAQSATAEPSPRPVTMTRAHAVRYELSGGNSEPNLIQYNDTPAGEGRKAGWRPGWPWTLEVQVPAGTIPSVRWVGADDATCRVIIDGVDVTGTFSDWSGSNSVHLCGATREP